MPELTLLREAAGRAGVELVEEAGWLVPAHFGDPAAEYEQARAGAGLFDQSHRGKVEVAGADAGTFLHNLCSNDVRGLPPGHGCEAFLLTAKAKVVAYALLFHQHLPPGGSAFWLDLAPGTSARVLQHLDRYIISEQVELADRTAEFAQLHLAGPRAEAVLCQVLPEGVPAPEPLRHTTAEGEGGAPCQVRRHDPLGVPGYDLVCPRDQAGELCRRLLEAGAAPAGLRTFEVLRVEAGTPLQGADVDENTFAPEVGRARQAISYTKGCYLGQEPVVMARDRGQVNRTLLGLKLPGGVVPPGSLVYRDGKEVGRVTSSVVSPRLGTAIALAYLRRGNQEPGTAVEVEVAGERRPAEVASLPFPH